MSPSNRERQARAVQVADEIRHANRLFPNRARRPEADRGTVVARPSSSSYRSGEAGRQSRGDERSSDE
jgi:hypothetical protein